MGNLDNVKAGVVVVTRFCKSNASEFSSYIDYIDRDEAKRKEKFQDFSLYNDYMGNPEKSTGLFTSNNYEVDDKKKKELKHVFRKAQEKGSLMWQTVISFDNRWLEEYGLWNSKTKDLDQAKIMEVASGSINKMLKNEKLENAIWTASIHYNTDNVHIHIAAVEPIPEREMKEYRVYKETGNFIKNKKGERVPEMVPVLDEKGEELKRKEYIGRFKGESISACKSHVVNEITNAKEQNIILNNIIRNSIVKQKRNISLYEDNDLKDMFLNLYTKMPTKGNKGLWNYGNSIMKLLRKEIDELSLAYMERYHKEDFEDFKKTLRDQMLLYKKAYGETDRNYFDSKLEDLYYRMGNAILKEIKEFSRSRVNVGINTEIDRGKRRNNVYERETIVNAGFKKRKYKGILKEELSLDSMKNEKRGIHSEEINFSEDENVIINDEVENLSRESIEKMKFNGKSTNREEEPVRTRNGFYIEWSDKYKQAMKMIFDPKEKGKKEQAITLLDYESKNGNALATDEIGNIFEYGRGVEISSKIAEKYYQEGFKRFMEIYKENKNEEKKEKYFLKSYSAYRVGKKLYYGQGIKQNYKSAVYFLEQSDTTYAKYMLGNFFYYGLLNDEKDYDLAYRFYKECENNGYALYKMGVMEENGEGVEKNADKAYKNYKEALGIFLKTLEDNISDDNLLYKVGYMYFNGKGTDVNTQEAEDYFKQASDLGNALAQCKMAQIYIGRGIKEEVEKAYGLLEEASLKGKNAMAQYVLGKLYADESNEKNDLSKALKWFLLADKNKNNFAAYQIGRIYSDMENGFYDSEKAEQYLKKAAKIDKKYAAFTLGKFYMQKEEYDKAEEYLKEAAENKNDSAEYLLGKMYTQPEYGRIDAEKGIYYFESVAKKENQFAQYALGMIYLRGNLVKKDDTKARKWLIESALQGNLFAATALENMGRKNNHPWIIRRLIFSKKENYEIEHAIRKLKKSLKSEAEKVFNLREYQKLQEKENNVGNEDIEF